jgi:uncharacterized membrane protein YkgB
MQPTDITEGEGGNTMNALYGSTTEVGAVQRIFTVAASLDGFGMALLRFGLVIVLVWIGGLKFARYEAEGIVPLVANSRLMSFFYDHPAPEYGLGIVIVSIGILIALHPLFPRLAAVGSFLLILMACATLSFR